MPEASAFFIHARSVLILPVRKMVRKLNQAAHHHISGAGFLQGIHGVRLLGGHLGSEFAQQRGCH